MDFKKENIMSDYWMSVSSVSEYATKSIDRSIYDSYTVHIWVYNKLKEKFTQTLTLPTNQEISCDLTRYSKEVGLKRHTQRFTLNCAMEKAIVSFRSELRVSENQITFPVPPLQSKYTDLKIRARKVWKKYLAQYGGISTTYGMLVLEEKWRDILHEQSQEMGVSLDYLPYILHSATIKQNEEQHLLRFNFLDPSSAHGKKAKRKFNLEKQNV